MPTARRDLEALAMSGVPIYATRGKGGGWRLIGGARTDLTGLTQDEVTSLLVGLTQGAAVEPERVAAMRKLMRAVPEPFRASAQRVADATVRDAPWGEAENAAERAGVARLQTAIARGRRVRFGYDGSRGPSEVEIVPLIVGTRGVRWYLLGARATEGSDRADVERLRTYRVDRMSALTVLDARGVAPEGFDHAEVWTRMVERVEGMRGGIRARVRVAPWSLRALSDRFGVQATVLDEEPDGEGRSLVEVSAHTPEALAEQLAGWTGAVEVIEPAEVRAALRTLGERIAALYA